MGESPSPRELREFCNLGYADGCCRLRERAWDSVRFGAKAGSAGEVNGNGGRIFIRYVCERGHRPVEHGTMIFDSLGSRWEQPHRDPRVQRMAECFLESYVEKRRMERAPVKNC